MTVHHLETTAATAVDAFRHDAPAVLSVEPGDDVVVRTLDVLGHERPFSGPDDGVPRVLGPDVGLTVTGPIEVRGALPGMVLAVHMVDLEPDDRGWTMVGWQGNHLEERLGVSGPTPTWVHWDVDDVARTVRGPAGLSVDLAPFLGIVGLPPRGPGAHPLVTPHASGGNLDCRALVRGSTLYLPVTVPGAMLHLGDGHAAQGDGEVAGTAVECGMRTRIRVELLTDAPLATLHADTPSGRITFGLGTDLGAASAQALAAMLSWIETLHPVDRRSALALATAAVDLRVTQIAAPVWGVHAVLPPGALRPD